MKNLPLYKFIHALEHLQRHNNIVKKHVGNVVHVSFYNNVHDVFDELYKFSFEHGRGVIDDRLCVNFTISNDTLCIELVKYFY